MSASRFAAQLRLCRVSDEFFDAYTRFMTALVAREQALAVSLLGPDVGAAPTGPLSREQLAVAVESMSAEQRNALAAAVAGGR